MKILVIDDELGLRHTLSLILAEEGHDVSVAPTGLAGLAAAELDSPDLVLCDVRMPEMDGFEFLDRYKASGGRALVIMMSAYGDDDATVEAIRRGAYDFIAKPFRADQVMLVVRKAIEREGLRHQVEQLTDAITVLRGPSELVGRSAAIRQVITLANKVAPHPSTVLVTGESGTGKELVARLVHSASLRANGSFVAVNCGAIPEALLESELFGHVRGAFTGASTERRGLFEEASGGTLFLDEIGELPQPLQVKLLRALQEGEVRPVGDNQSRRHSRSHAALRHDVQAPAGLADGECVAGSDEADDGVPMAGQRARAGECRGTRSGACRGQGNRRRPSPAGRAGTGRAVILRARARRPLGEATHGGAGAVAHRARARENGRQSNARGEAARSLASSAVVQDSGLWDWPVIAIRYSLFA